jgi:hypothetical protein
MITHFYLPHFFRIFSFIVLFNLLFLITPVLAQKTVQQSTQGDQSPAISTTSGNVTITYTMAEESIKVLKEFIESKNMENQELRRRVAEIHKNEFNSLPAEADEWAVHFLSTLPLRKDRLFEAEKEEKRKLDAQIINIPIILNFAIQSFDSRIEAIHKRVDKVVLQKKTDYNTFFVTNTDQLKEKSDLRIVSFPNGSIVRVSLSLGFIRDKSINPYPSLQFELIIGKSIKESFQVYRGWPPTIGGHGQPIKNGVYYNPYGEDDGKIVIHKGYTSQLNSAYDSLLEAAFVP